VTEPPPGARPRRTPSQSRSRELVRAIVEAAGRIVSAEPSARAGSFSTNHVARIAGVTLLVVAAKSADYGPNFGGGSGLFAR
jgi:hypothetical protein